MLSKRTYLLTVFKGHYISVFQSNIKVPSPQQKKLPSLERQRIFLIPPFLGREREGESESERERKRGRERKREVGRER
jgi:hypothetical protein